MPEPEGEAGGKDNKPSNAPKKQGMEEREEKIRKPS
jgi:hypothetical protein